VRRTAIALWGAGVLVALGVAACRKPLRPGDPVRGLTRAERALFDRGRELAGEEFTPETGLGPLFNAPSCGECHEKPALGGSGDEVEVHVARLLPNGVCDPFADQGGLVIQQHATPALMAALGIDKEPTPAEAMPPAARSTPGLFGFGLLDAVSNATILSFADPDDANHDGISGRPNRSFDGRIGRFGRKALVPTLREFNDGAFPVEQGVTNPAVPTEEPIGGRPIPAGVDLAPEPEVDSAFTDAVDAFVRFLAVPSSAKLDRQGKAGRRLFVQTGCAACHVPRLTTGDSPVRALRRKTFAAFTDLLLHDMGPELADICLGSASPSEFRTEPLIGLRHATQFLHGGQAKSIEQAIELHGGEADGARARFRALTATQREALLKYLRSL
jgi:CxxC motif-containing protein (DUF1111 family)